MSSSSSFKVDEAKSTDDPSASRTNTNSKSDNLSPDRQNPLLKHINPPTYSTHRPPSSAPIVEPPEKEKQTHNGTSITSKHDHQRPRKQQPPMEDSPSQDGKKQNQNQPPPDRNVEREQPEKDKQPFNGAISSKHVQQRKQYRTVEDPPSQDRDNHQNQPSPPPRSVEQPEKDTQRQSTPSKQHRPPSKDLNNHSQNQPPQPPARNVEQPENDIRPFNGVTPSKESKQDHLSKQYLPMEGFPSKEPKKQSNPPPLPARNVEQPENDRQPSTTVTSLKQDHPPKQYLPMEDSPSKEPKQHNHPPPQHLQAYIPADYVIQPDGPPAETQPHPSLDTPESDKSGCCCIL